MIYKSLWSCGSGHRHVLRDTTDLYNLDVPASGAVVCGISLWASIKRNPFTNFNCNDCFFGDRF